MVNGIIILHVTQTILPTEVALDRPDPSAGQPDPLVEETIREFEPIVMLQRRSMAKVWQDRSVSKMNLQLLLLLTSRGPLSMSRLAALADVSLSNLTGIVSRMEEHGLAERVRDDHDRRVVLVRATPRGQTTCEGLEELRRQNLREILESLAESDKRLCLKAIRVMRRAAERLHPELSTQSVPHHSQPDHTRGAQQA
jgi:DNA-binding MarR family transcriptional regulator